MGNSLGLPGQLMGVGSGKEIVTCTFTTLLDTATLSNAPVARLFAGDLTHDPATDNTGGALVDILVWMIVCLCSLLFAFRQT